MSEAPGYQVTLTAQEWQQVLLSIAVYRNQMDRDEKIRRYAHLATEITKQLPEDGMMGDINE